MPKLTFLGATGTVTGSRFHLEIEGKNLTDCTEEFPAGWFENAILCSEKHDPELNFFKINALQPLKVWQDKDWIYPLK